MSEDIERILQGAHFEFEDRDALRGSLMHMGKRQTGTAWLWAASSVSIAIGVLLFAIVWSLPPGRSTSETISVLLTSTPEPVPTATGTFPERPAPLIPTPTRDPFCPTLTGYTRIYRSDANGYCFLYPFDWSISDDWLTSSGGVVITAPQHNLAEQRYFYVQVMHNGPADDGETAEAYAAAWQAEHMQPGITLPTEPTIIGGEPAVQISDALGMGLTYNQNQMAFVVAHGQRFRIAIEHRESWYPAFEAEAAAAWDRVTESIRFHPPAAPPQTTTTDICPQPGEDQRVFINQRLGVCFLYPEDFGPDPPETDTLTTGEAITDHNGIDVLPRFGVMVTGRPEPGVALTTFGGLPAIIYIDDNTIPGPMRRVTLEANGGWYTLWASPYDPLEYPAAAASLDRIWHMVDNTIVFFQQLE